jgi:hypothetical protein
MCLTELFYFFWDSLSDPNKVFAWLIIIPLSTYLGVTLCNIMDKYLGWVTSGVIYAIIVITMFATGFIGWC